MAITRIPPISSTTAKAVRKIFRLNGTRLPSRLSTPNEKAKIEGCTAWESFWKITLPMVSSMILVNIVYTVIDFFLKTDNTVMDRIDAIGIGGRMDYGQASAMAWVYFLCVIVALGIVSLIISRRVYYYE